MTEILRAGELASELLQTGSAPLAPDEWPEPQPLPDELPPVQPFDTGVLPASLRGWIEDTAERVQCPPDFPAVAGMIALATVVGRKVGIRPRRQDDWLVVPNLWGAVIGPPSVMKTPAIQEALKPLTNLELAAKRAYDAAVRDHEAEQLVSELRKQSIKKQIRALASDGAAALAAAREALQEDKQVPARRRYLVNDSSVEKLGELLRDNPNGVLCFRDELIGLLKGLEKEGQEGARAFFLEARNGSGRYTYDRIGRGTIDIEAAAISVLGSIQPGPLRAYLRDAVSDGAGADGLMQRFQLAVYPDVAREWRNVDRWPDTRAKKAATEAITRLAHLDPTSLAVKTADSGDGGIPYVRFDAPAQKCFDAWRNQLELRLRSDAEHPAITAHLAKYRSLVPSLALLTHLADAGIAPVTADALDRAMAWAAYLESHARRIYAVAVAPDTVEAAALARKLQRGELPDEFALRDVYRAGWIGLGTREAAARAVEVLCDLDWLQEIVQATGGRNRTRYQVNPRVRRSRRT